jgi:asparagine synthase (glutamine-hydrolysing)
MSISAESFRDFLPQYVWHMEEPVCEPPAVALYYITKLAREHVKVLISGEGGDEAFAGYQNYRNLVWLERLKATGQPWKGAASALLAALGKGKSFSRLTRYSPLMDVPLKDYYFSRTSGPSQSFNDLRNRFYTTSFLNDVRSGSSLRYLRECFARVAGQSVLNQMLYVDTKTWLPDDLLVKADKITMANSVELRVPLLDHKVLEFAATLSPHYKVNGFNTKFLLKNALKGRVPAEVIKRKKTGFPVPYEAWLRNALRDWVQDILLDRRATNRGYFEKGAVEALLDQNTRSGGYSKEIFSLVVLELWHRVFLEGEAPAGSRAGRDVPAMAVKQPY